MKIFHTTTAAGIVGMLFFVSSCLAEDDLYEQFNAVFKVKAGYMDSLTAAAYAKTKNPSFQRPKGKNLLWEPRPIFSLKALGLSFPKNTLIMYSAQKSLFFAEGSDEWLEALQNLHEKNGIAFERIKKKP